MTVSNLLDELRRISCKAATLRPALVGVVPDEKSRAAVVGMLDEIQAAVDGLADRLARGSR